MNFLALNEIHALQCAVDLGVDGNRIRGLTVPRPVR